MGLLGRMRDLETGGTPLRFVDENDKSLLYLPEEFAGGEIEILRSDLSTLLVEHSRSSTEYIFGDSISALAEDDNGIDVTFKSGTSRRFDLVIAADGIHSHVRQLTFGHESNFISHLGYYLAGWDLPNYLSLSPETLMYNVPGRLASVGGDHRDQHKASTLFMFASERIDYDRHDHDEQKRIVAGAFEGLDWEVPRLVESLGDAEDLYFDSISRVDIPSWSRGRVALVGDAACGATLGTWEPEPRSWAPPSSPEN